MSSNSGRANGDIMNENLACCRGETQLLLSQVPTGIETLNRCESETCLFIKMHVDDNKLIRFESYNEGCILMPTAHVAHPHMQCFHISKSRPMTSY